MNVFKRIDVGLRAWFGAWFVAGAAEKIAPSIRPGTALPAPEPETKAPSSPPVKTKPAPPPAPARSDALTLLEIFQREARLIDFLQEDLAGYDDAQIGAAVRDVHRDSAKVLERLFALKPVIEQEEGAAVPLTEPSGGRIRQIGNVREGATQGTVVHAGWQATKADLPKWTGSQDAKQIVAPAEVEV